MVWRFPEVILLCSLIAYVGGDYVCNLWFIQSCNEYDVEQCVTQDLDCLSFGISQIRRETINDICVNNICYILRVEPGLINSRESKTIPRGIVPCNSIRKKYSHISGPVLDIFSETFPVEENSSSTEMCLFVDEGCGNLDLMHFVQSKKSKEMSYRFAIGPVAEATLPKCYHQESGAWLDDKIVVVGSFEESGHIDRMLLVFDPFETRALLFLLGMLVLFFAFAAMIYVRVVWVAKMKRTSFFFILTGAYDEADEAAELEQEGPPRGESKKAQGIKIITMKYAVITALLRFSFAAMMVTFFLFMEAGAVNDLSERQAQSNRRLNFRFEDIEDFTQYCVQNNSVLLEVARKKASWNESENDFVKQNSIEDCFDELRKETSSVQFVVTHKLAADYILSDKDLCDQYTVLELDESIYEFNSRWIFNSGVDKEYVESFNRKLVSLRINGKIQELLNSYAPECVSQPRDFRFRTGHTVLLMAIFVIFPFLVGLIALIHFERKNRRERKEQK